MFPENNFHKSHKGKKADQTYGKSFTQSSTLKSHVIINTGERPHKCTSCGKSFICSSHLKTHMMIHNGERPFKTGTYTALLVGHGATHTHTQKP